MSGLKFDYHNNFTKNFARNLLVFIATIMVMSPALANPVLGNVAAGGATITQTPNTTQVLQTTQKTIINWNSFNIGAQQSTSFVQPAGGVALNRISPTQGPSQIFGMLSATGTIILVNQAGIFFGPTAHVDVNGLIATTSDISNRNFLMGNYRFDKPSPYPNASITNQGRIIARQNGLVALVGNNVENDGYIRANLGNVVLASGSKFTVSFDNDQMINFTINQGASRSSGSSNKAAVINRGTIVANGGRILLTAQAARGVLDNAIDMQGVAIAKSVHQHNGEIILSGGDGLVTVASAKLIASGRHHGQTGGLVQISGRNIVVKGHTKIDVSGNAGGGKILIGSKTSHSKRHPATSTTSIGPQTILLADALTQGNGGIVSILSTDETSVAGQISAKGGAKSGNGGSVETSGNYLNINGASINLLASHGKTGTWLLDPEDVFITTTSPTSGGSFNGSNPNVFTPTADDSNIFNQDIENNLASANVTITTGSTGSQLGNIFVNAPIAWSSGNVLTLNAANNIAINADIIGTSNGLLSGTPNGGLVLSAGSNTNTITATGNIAVATFNLAQGAWSQNTATLPSSPSFTASNNFTIASGASFLRVAGGTGTAGSPYQITDVYGLQGIATQPLSNSYILNNTIDATVTQNWNSGAGFVPIGTSSAPFTGHFNGAGLTINNLYINTPSLTLAGLFGNASSGIIQGVGVTNANITDSNASASGIGILAGELSSGTINNSYSTGAVNGTSFVGGLVGVNSGIIENSYNTGTVTAPNSSAVGGLVGLNNVDISNSYNTGTVIGNGSSQVGGLVGLNQSGLSEAAIENSHSTGPVQGSNQVGGLVGENSNINNNELIANSYSTSQVTGNSDVGGLVGLNQANIELSHSSGPVQGSAQVGGLVGLNDNGGTIFDSYSTSQTTSNSGPVGGLVGENQATITTSFSNGPVQGSVQVGGLVGLNDNSGTISGSYSTGPVTGNSSDVGGLVGENLATITTSYSSGPVKGSTQVGGLVGFNSGGTISDSYSASPVTGSNEVGGFVGENEGSIATSYSTGLVTGSGSAAGFAGANFGGTINNSFWDAETSGKSFAIGFGIGPLPSVTSGCFGSSCGGADLTQASTFTGWNISTTPVPGTNTWGIIDGASYPYLVALYPSTPRAISGSTTSGGGSAVVFPNVTLPSNPSFSTGLAQASVLTGANGFYYFLEPNGFIPDNTALLAYVDHGNANAVTVTPSTGGSITGLNMTSNTVSVGDNNNNAISNTTLVNALGGLSSLTNINILYDNTPGPNDITLTSGTSFVTSSNTNYSINGGIATSGGGNITFNRPVDLASDSAISTDSGTINFGSTINGAFALTLNTNTSGNIGLGGNIGNIFPLTRLTINGGGAVTMNGDSVTTTGSQIYNDKVTLGTNTALTGNTAITLANGVAGGTNLSLANNASSTAFTLAGNLLLNNISVNGVTGTNSLDVQTGSPIQNWLLTGANSGLITVTGTNSQITGPFTFGGIQSLLGGNGSTNVLIGNGSKTNAFSIAGLNVGSVIDPISFSNFNTFSAGTPNNSNNDTVTFSTGLNPQGTIVSISPSVITVTLNGFGPMTFLNFGHSAFPDIFPSTPTPTSVTPATSTTPSADEIAALDNTIVSQTTITETTTTNQTWQNMLLNQNLILGLTVGEYIQEIDQEITNDLLNYNSDRKLYPNCNGRI